MNDQIYFSGDYQDWLAATRVATGYDQKEILDKVLSATLAGKAVSQRDGFLLEQIPYNFPLISTLLRAALQNQNRLDILDFGGSLGSSYFDSAGFIDPISDLSWSIVEEPHFVAAGQEHLSTDQLQFFPTIEDYARTHRPNVVVLSGVVQYLPDPWNTLQLLRGLESSYLFFDRTAFINAVVDRLTIQHVPSWLYEAKIPAWFLSEAKFQHRLSESGYRVISDFEALDRYSFPGAKVAFKGFICEKDGPR